MFSIERYFKKITKRLLKTIFLPKIKTKQGYIKNRKVFSKSKYEHREIAESILGRKLKPNEVVHHIDFNKRNNHPSNLCVMLNKDHKHYHNWHRWMEKNKPMTQLTIDYRRQKLKERWDCIILA